MVKLKVGDCFYCRRDKYKYHVVAVLDEPEEIKYVIKYFGKYKQWWHYEVKGQYQIDLWFESRLYAFNKQDFIEKVNKGRNYE